jgi:hypothetical protein
MDGSEIGGGEWRHGWKRRRQGFPAVGLLSVITRRWTICVRRKWRQG